MLRQRLLAKENNLRNLTKRYLSFVSSIESSTTEEAEAMYQGLLKELTAYEFTVLKARAHVDTNLRQIADYDAMQQTIDAEMCAAPTCLARFHCVPVTWSKERRYPPQPPPRAPGRARRQTLSGWQNSSRRRKKSVSKRSSMRC